MNKHKKIVCLCGGVGGAKLALGFSKILSPEQLVIVVNTGDDFEYLGYPISPDIDTVIYTLAGINNKTQGWGVEGESWDFMESLAASGKESWFRLGDKDLQTHTLRKQLLNSGKTLSQTTNVLCETYRVLHPVIPMSDDKVSTMITTAEADLPFQHYFVREQCKPAVRDFYFNGISSAKPSAGFLQALDDPALEAIVICPSNPYVSINPILALPGIRQKLGKSGIPVIAVSPIIGGKAIKGPTAKMMDELNIAKTSRAIAEHYRELLSTLIVDHTDAGDIKSVEQLGIRCLSTQTLMKTDADKVALARFILANF